MRLYNYKVKRSGINLKVQEEFEKYEQILNPTAIYNIVKSLYSYNEWFAEEREYFTILYLNNKNKVIGYDLHTVGSANCGAVYIRELMRNALYANALNIVLVHNHPSGDLQPSSSDIEITKKIKNACDSLQIKLIDHLIISEVSFNTLIDYI